MKLISMFVTILYCSIAIAEPRVKILELEGVIINFNVEQDKDGNFVKNGDVEGKYSDLTPAIKGKMLNDKYIGKLTQWWPNGKVMSNQLYDNEGEIISSTTFDEKGNKLSEVEGTSLKAFRDGELVTSMPMDADGKVFIRGLNGFDLDMEMDEVGIKENSEITFQYHEIGSSVNERIHIARARFHDRTLEWYEVQGFKLEDDQTCIIESSSTTCTYPNIRQMIGDLIQLAIQKCLENPVEFKF